MAEESEKKPGFVVHKKAQTQPQAQTPAAPEKKRVVVVRKNPSQNAPQDASKNDAAKKSPVKVVVKKAETQAPQAEKPAKPAPQAPAADAPKPAASQAPQRPRTFELNQARPNVKAGNLSDHGRQNNNRGGYNRGGQGGQGGYNNYHSSGIT